MHLQEAINKYTIAAEKVTQHCQNSPSNQTQKIFGFFTYKILTVVKQIGELLLMYIIIIKKALRFQRKI